MSTEKGEPKAQPSKAPVKRKRTPRRAQQVTVVPAEDSSPRLSPEAIRYRAYWDGYLAALKAIEPSRWQDVQPLAYLIVVAVLVAWTASDFTRAHLKSTGQIVSVRTCGPVMLRDLDSRRRRLEEQIESLQPRGYAALEAR